MTETAERFERAAAVLAALITGVVVGALGSVFYRVTTDFVPSGLVVALAAVGLGAVFLRALAGRAEYVAYPVAVLASVGAASAASDRILLVQGVGILWIVGAVLLAVIGVLLPRQWFGAP